MREGRLRLIFSIMAFLAALLLSACGGASASPATPTLILPPTFTPTVTPRPVTRTPIPIIITPTETPIVDPVTPTPADHIATLNGIPYSEFIILDSETEAHVRAIYERGQTLGRDPRAFSKLGDSLIATKHFLRVFDGRDPNLGDYNLGEYAYLQDTINYFAGSFHRYGKAVRLGMNTRMVFDPKWADEKACGGGVNLLDCEIWAHNPSFMFVQLGTNDHYSLALFQENYERIVEYLIYQGVVPILFTKADRFADPLNQNTPSSARSRSHITPPSSTWIAWPRLCPTVGSRLTTSTSTRPTATTTPGPRPSNMARPSTAWPHSSCSITCDPW